MCSQSKSHICELTSVLDTVRVWIWRWRGVWCLNPRHDVGSVSQNHIHIYGKVLVSGVRIQRICCKYVHMYDPISSYIWILRYHIRMTIILEYDRQPPARLSHYWPTKNKTIEFQFHYSMIILIFNHKIQEPPGTPTNGCLVQHPFSM